MIPAVKKIYSRKVRAGARSDLKAYLHACRDYRFEVSKWDIKTKGEVPSAHSTVSQPVDNVKLYGHFFCASNGGKPWKTPVFWPF